MSCTWFSYLWLLVSGCNIVWLSMTLSRWLQYNLVIMTCCVARSHWCFITISLGSVRIGTSWSSTVISSWIVAASFKWTVQDFAERQKVWNNSRHFHELTQTDVNVLHNLEHVSWSWTNFIHIYKTPAVKPDSHYV